MISKVWHDLHTKPKSVTEIGWTLVHWDIEKYINMHEYVDILFFG